MGNRGNLKVRPDPFKALSPDFELKTGKTDTKRRTGVLMAEIRQAVSDGKIGNRQELCRFLDEELGVTVTRHGKDYLSVKLPGTAKAVRLKGELFQEGTDYWTLRDAKSRNTGPVLLTGPEFETAKNRLQTLVQERHDYNVKMFQPSKRLGQMGSKAHTQPGTARAVPVPIPSAQPGTITTQGGKTMGDKQNNGSKPTSSKQATQALITDVKSQVKKVEAELSSNFTPPSKTMVRANIGIARTKALSPEGGIMTMGLDSMALIDAAIVELTLSIDAANAQLRGARTPEDERRARDLLWKLEEQLRRLRDELRRLQTGAKATAPKRNV